MLFIGYFFYGAQLIRDILYFWGFWIILIFLVIGLIEGNISAPARVVLAFVFPQLIVTGCIAFFVDYLFMRKKAMLFFLISLPFAFVLGLAMISFTLFGNDSLMAEISGTIEGIQNSLQFPMNKIKPQVRVN